MTQLPPEVREKIANAFLICANPPADSIKFMKEIEYFFSDYDLIPKGPKGHPTEGQIHLTEEQAFNLYAEGVEEGLYNDRKYAGKNGNDFFDILKPQFTKLLEEMRRGNE